MKKKYLLVRDGFLFNPRTVVYHLYVGHGARELARFRQIENLASKKGWLLWPYDDAADALVWCKADEIFTSLGLCNFGFVGANIDTVQCLQLDRLDFWQKFEDSLSLPKGSIPFLRQNNLRRHSLNRRVAANLFDPDAERKNLSHGR